MQSNVSVHKRARFIKLGVIILIILGLASVEIATPGFYGKVWHLTVTGNVGELAALIRSYGPWAWVLSFWLNVLVNAASVLPSIIFSTANGLVFGVIPGILLSWIAESIGVIISFYIMRYFLQDMADRMVQKSKFFMKVEDFSERNGFIVMLFARAIPYFPSGLITALGAVSKIRPRDYILATFIGKLPSTVVEVAVGHDALSGGAHLHRLMYIIVVAVVGYYVLWRVYKRFMDRRRSEVE